MLQAMYCNEKCRHLAEDFHQHEHKIWPYLHAIKSSQRDLIATRIIELFGPRNLLDLFRQVEHDEHSFNILTRANPPGFDQNHVYDASTYGPIFHLVSHSEPELLDNVSNAFKAILLTNLLKEQSNFFQQMETTDEETTAAGKESQLFDFTASLILHHLENIPYNAISLNEFRCEENNVNNPRGVLLRQRSHLGVKSVPYASAIFGLLAMCNHSCSPNAVHVRSAQRNETALVALRSLRAGEEICITYGPLFTVHEWEDRQRILKDKYNFDCSCDACTNRWSLKGPSDVIALEKYKKVEVFEKQLHQVHELIEQSKYIEAISKLQPCLHFFGSNFPQTFPLTQVAQDLFKKALIFVVNC
ncbi:unnamed protein product [Allacma fusca]|uniref:SET domain-containing protein n=1 Tax=Allacma fusca TaxID=39272 RepID=A0A8J2JI57_9HEXA|nr:unnamed protein product [Allacma fusca]